MLAQSKSFQDGIQQSSYDFGISILRDGLFCAKSHSEADIMTKICKVDGCDTKHFCKGYCSKHHYQFKIHGRIMDDEYEKLKNRTCSVGGCGKKYFGKGYCNGHFLQIWKYGKITNNKLRERHLPDSPECIVKGCEGKHRTKGYCNKHYKQYIKYGKILERTPYTPNKIIIHEDYAEIELYNRKSELVACAKIDLEDIPKIKNKKLFLDKYGYARETRKKENIQQKRLHQIIYGDYDKEKYEIDHKNANKLDNQRCNLRLLTHKHNVWNRIRNDTLNGDIKGIFWLEKEKRWLVNFGRIRLGRFDNKDEAISCRINYEEKMFKGVLT